MNASTDVRLVYGLQPRFPKPFQRLFDSFGMMPGERLAAFRIAVGLVFLVDLLWLYAPILSWLYGPNSLAAPDVFEHAFLDRLMWWSVIDWFPKSYMPKLCLLAGVAAGFGLIFGIFSKLSAVIGWAVSMSFLHSNPYCHNGGDMIKISLLFLLIFAPGDATWTVTRPRAKVLVHPWWFAMLVVQMCMVYCLNGYRKFAGPQWLDGTMTYYVFENSTWAHWRHSSVQMPIIVYKLASWFTLVWETGFPLFLAMPITRKAILWIGAGFHVFTFFHLEIGAFAMYALCFYVPFLPWERWTNHHETTPPV
jgi:hypothetical protein